MRFVISEEAANDLEDFGDRTARNDPSAAIVAMKELLRYCRAVALAPTAWGASPELGEGIRFATYDRWAIYYSLREDEVRIERLLPHRRRRICDLPASSEDDQEF